MSATKADNADPRLAALRSYGILDTPPEAAFDDIVEAASAFCDVPIALVSLVDEDRQWFKACLGLNVTETPVDQAVCAFAIRQSEPLVIPDLALDPRTAKNPLVTSEPHIRFYAGAQLVTRAGHALGTLCVIDTDPRPGGLTADQHRGLVALARQVTHHIEMRQAVEERDATLVMHLRLGDEAKEMAAASERARRLAEARDERSLAAQEAGRVGTFELDVRTDIANVSPEFCRIFGLPEAPQYNFESLEAHMVSVEDAHHSVRADRSDGTAAADVEYRIRRPSDGAVRWIARRARFELENGRAVRMLGTVHDVTERRQEAERTAALLELGDLLREADTIAETISAASRILGRELDVDRVGYATIDRTAGTFGIERDWTAEGVPSLVGEHPLSGVDATLEQLASDQTMSLANVPAATWLGSDRQSYRSFGAQALINVPLVIRRELRGVLFVHSRRTRAWTNGEIGFAHGVADRAYATIAQLEAEEQRNVLNQELSHRMKNMLAIVQAIANQTLKNVDDRDAVTALDRRINALSTAHDVLLQDHWSSASVGGVIERVLGAIGIGDRVCVRGPAISFGPRAALALSLLLHELSTNAVKYGALSVDGGRVTLHWSVEGVAGDATFRMEWRETGGPEALEPVQKGFGSRLIRMGLLGTGGTETRYLASGFEADFSVPLDRANAE